MASLTEQSKPKRKRRTRQPYVPTGRPPGAPAFQPTDDQRQMVTVLRGMQVPLATIARNVVPGGMSEQTLKKHFSAELETGRDLLLASLKTKIVQAAQNGSVRAQTWLLERLAPEEFGNRLRVSPDSDVVPSTLTIQPNAQVSIYLPDNGRGEATDEPPTIEGEAE